MTTIRTLGSMLGLTAALALGACANVNPPSANAPLYPSAYPQSTQANNAYVQYGVVQSIDLVRPDNAGVGVGTIAGAVIGGIVGNQIGGGRGKTAATVVGAVGGAYAGHELENRNQQQTEASKFTIRMRDGSFQSVTQTTNADIRVGDRVQIENGVVRRY